MKLTLFRQDEAEAFVCGRCTRPKKSKLVAERVKDDGTKDLICNGCYGNLKSKEK